MFTRASKFYQEVASLLPTMELTGRLFPPSAPHYGGLWEAGVKSVKHHLKRVGEHILTFEELSIVLVEIEACLNSRPLGPLSSDLNDLPALTPSYFLNDEFLFYFQMLTYSCCRKIGSIGSNFSSASETISGSVGQQNICSTYRSGKNGGILARTLRWVSLSW